jgi:hypothetical protein
LLTIEKKKEEEEVVVKFQFLLQCTYYTKMCNGFGSKVAAAIDDGQKKIN